VIATAARKSPLVHHITNGVVKNFSANVTIAAHASPAMSESPEEFNEFASVPDVALLLNMGTATAENVLMFKDAVRAYNRAGKPIVFDPVGCGASTHRRQACRAILNTGDFAVIKGNEGEITAAARAEGAAMKGVDSVGGSDLTTRTAICSKLAHETHSTVLMTGKEDILVDPSGAQPLGLVFSNGHDFMGCITGSGCSLGSLIAIMAAVCKDNVVATTAALLVYTIAAERAAARPEVRGPGTFVPALIDEIYLVVEETLNGDNSWLGAAQIKAISL
jgi:thiamine-phosphate diphosphorylase/hydroxyethylthiazole kinase